MRSTAPTIAVMAARGCARAAPAMPQQLIDLLNDAARKEPLGDSAVWADLFNDFNTPFGGPTASSG